jgi:deazaflavin-dependent oxidoreductase (nitroreductase family)
VSDQHSSAVPDFNQRVIGEFRANGGSVGGMFQGSSLILITTAGRRSGRPRTNPVAYREDGGRYLIFGSNQGREQHPGWYHNLLASPQVTMEIGTGDGRVRAVAARAVGLHGAERDRLYQLQSADRPAFGDYQEKTARIIPVIALYPLDLSEDSERSRLVGEQVIAHHNDLRARLGRLRATIMGDGAGVSAPDLAEQLRQHCLSFCYGLELHHIREDGAFSAFEQRFPHLTPVISRLRSEHRAMARALAVLEALLTRPGDASETLAAFDEAVTGLEEHFAYEEEQLIAALTSLAAAAVLHSPDEAKAGPVLVDGGDLHVDQAEWQRDLTDHVVGDIAAMAGRPARPGGPDGSIRVYPLRQGRQLGGQSGRGGEEGDHHIGGTGSGTGSGICVGVGQVGRRVGEIPAVRAVHDGEPQARFEPELGSLCHHVATDGFGRAGTSTQ